MIAGLLPAIIPSAVKRLLPTLASAACLAACSHLGTSAPDAWVLVGPQGLLQVRTAIEPGAACPTIDADGRPLPMQVRARSATPVLRPTAMGPAETSKPVWFPLDVCEATLPSGIRHASLGRRTLPLMPSQPRRIVVLGDTGCRVKGSFAQDCSDPKEWPFARIAEAAASMHPDLVVHVGDYHYRESPCPSSQPGCAGSPWGYGWDTWKADFFVPAAPLLRAAPWVVARGNHEECMRAGQGWFRLLAPEPFDPRRSCDNAGNDDEADFTEPYAVPLGPALQLVVFDSAHAGSRPLKLDQPGDAATFAHYKAQWQQVGALVSRPGMTSWVTSHHQVLAFAPREDGPPYPGNPALLATMESLNGKAYFPAGVQLALHGHVHLFQAIGFDSGHPAALVAGHGGDSADDALPHPLPTGATPADGAHIAHMTHSDRFGFLLLERAGVRPDDWTITAFRADGGVLTHCALRADRSLQCDPAGRVR